MTAKKPAAKKAPAKKAPVKAVISRKTGKPLVKRPPKPPRKVHVAKVEKAKQGQPTLYKPEYDLLAYKLCLMGATDKRLAELMECSERSINEWKEKHPTFSQSIREGREIADAEIAHALYHRAKGYTHSEDDIRTVALGNNQGSEIVITPTVKHYPPDTTAASLWLRNRQGATWREKTEVEHSGSLGLEKLPDDELELRWQEMQTRMAGAAKAP